MGGIRTRVPLITATRFPVVLVMTTSIPLQSAFFISFIIILQKSFFDKPFLQFFLKKLQIFFCGTEGNIKKFVVTNIFLEKILTWQAKYVNISMLKVLGIANALFKVMVLVVSNQLLWSI